MSAREPDPPGHRRVRLSGRALATKRKMASLAAGGPAAEAVWSELVRSMDEAYATLAGYEAALENKNAELADARDFTDSVIASMSDVLAIVDREGNVVDVNPALEHLVGRRRSALKGTPLLDLFADEDSRRRARCLVSMGRPGIVQDCELALAARDGAAVPVAMNCTPRYGRGGRVAGMVVTGRPVGELRRAYRELGAAHEELKRAQAQLLHAEKLASIGRLVAGIAHELNNPISFVLGNVHVLAKYVDRIRAYIEAVNAGTPSAGLAALRETLRVDSALGDLESLLAGTIEGAERTRAIVDGLKRFAASDREPEGEVDLAEVLRRAAHWVERGAGMKLRVTFDLAPDLRVWGSANQLQQVAVNLVQNAADATATSAVPALQVTGRVERGCARIELRDNGQGIAPEHLRRIFEPFFTTKPVGKGTGLGLSISYAIVERHGGRLEASSAPGGGALFTLSLPTAPAPRRASGA